MLWRFDYQERGTMDRKHLRFFTWQTLQSMLRLIGLEVQKIRITPIPLLQIHSFFRNTRLGRRAYQGIYRLKQFYPRLFGYQFGVKISNNKGIMLIWERQGFDLMAQVYQPSTVLYKSKSEFIDVDSSRLEMQNLLIWANQ
jgi:hypothetical protein